ncbi:MAG TPA: hypothetical protein PKE21_01950 [Flavobacteriales bacterium]|nr:hypothetical protein [Flavobacteriales bacterium]HMR26217.1 hypothetical protein [Flavobacteriales bacterium]
MQRRAAQWTVLGCSLIVSLLPACGHTELEDAQPGPETASDILFLDPEPDPSTTAPWWGPVRIDLDQDSMVDVELHVLYTEDSSTPWPEPLWGTRAVAADSAVRITAGTIGGGYLPLLEGDPIDNDLTWSSAITFHQEVSGGGITGLWPTPTTGYIGVERLVNGAAHRGWVSVRTEASSIAYRSSGFQRGGGAMIGAGEAGQ